MLGSELLLLLLLLHWSGRSHTDDAPTWTSFDACSVQTLFSYRGEVRHCPDRGKNFDATRVVEQGWMSRSLFAPRRQAGGLGMVAGRVNEDVNMIPRNASLLMEAALWSSLKRCDDGVLTMVSCMIVDGGRSCA